VHTNQLVIEGRTVSLAVSRETLDEVAELALGLAIDRTRQAGALLTAVMARDYLDRSETERAALREASRDVLIALVLLGIVEQPAG
jgi:hypothetical protein